MKIYPKQTKSDRPSNDGYFGNYGEIPLGISLAHFKKDDIIEDPLHFHQKGFEFYLIVEGAGILEVNGKEIELNSENVAMVEPGEKHRIKSILKVPFRFFAVCTSKDKEYKIIIHE